MDSADTAKFRLDALNLAYGILINQYQSKLGTSTPLANPVPTTERVIAEAEKIIGFLQVV